MNLLADEADTLPDNAFVVEVPLPSEAPVAAALLAEVESTCEENLSPYWFPPEDKVADEEEGGLPYPCCCEL